MAEHLDALKSFMFTEMAETYQNHGYTVTEFVGSEDG
jgi:hypothetical protein